MAILYRKLFYGRQDVFAVRWENEKDRKRCKGYRSMGYEIMDLQKK